MNTLLEILRADALMAARFAPARFVVPEILPEGLTLLAGRPKLGKSWLAMNISLAVAAGSPALGRPLDGPGDVLHLALEDGPRRLQERLRLMLADQPAPARLAFATACPALDAGGADAIRMWARAASAPRLVVVDVFQRVRPKGDRGARLYADDYSAALPLKAIADEIGCAVLAVTHTRKGDAADDPLDGVSATTGLTGAADHVLILDRDKNGTALYGRGRDVAEIDLALRFDPRRGTWLPLGDKAELARSDTRNAILATLREAGSPAGPAEIARRSGLDTAVVKKRLAAMVAAGEAVKLARGTYAPPIPSIPIVPNPASPPPLSFGGQKGREAI